MDDIVALALWQTIMNQYHTLTPAYGRDYNNKASAKEDLRNGKDFILSAPQGTTYCSVRDFRKGDVLNVRYKKQRNVASFTLKEDGKL